MKLREIALDLGLVAAPPVRRVLIVEDAISVAEGLARYVDELGHDVVVLSGIERIEGDRAVGFALDGTESTIDLRGFNFAFLDHYFLGAMNGASLTPELVKRGCWKIVAMSSDMRANEHMVALGATVAVRKRELGF